MQTNVPQEYQKQPGIANGFLTGPLYTAVGRPNPKLAIPTPAEILLTMYSQHCSLFSAYQGGICTKAWVRTGNVYRGGLTGAVKGGRSIGEGQGHGEIGEGGLESVGMGS